jgi:hypothetical protein
MKNIHVLIYGSDFTWVIKLKASLAMFCMQLAIVKLNEEKLIYANLVQENGFGLT